MHKRASDWGLQYVKGSFNGAQGKCWFKRVTSQENLSLGLLVHAGMYSKLKQLDSFGFANDGLENLDVENKSAERSCSR